MPWYKERLLGSVSVGSLMVIVLVRTVQTNLSGAHDAYVHTNCLAALANIAPLLRKLHPHAARCLVSLYDLFARKFLKMSRKEAERKSTAEGGLTDAGSRYVAPSADGDVSGRSEEDGSSDEALQMAVDFLRISLEALNLCLTAGPALNEHLVYALLERQAIFGTLREHEVRGCWSLDPSRPPGFTPDGFTCATATAIASATAAASSASASSAFASAAQLDGEVPCDSCHSPADHDSPPCGSRRPAPFQLFSDLIENIDLVIEHFGATIGATSADGGEGGDSVWSVETVLSHIRDASLSWKADKLRQLADLRFTYEQEPAPEEFFTPYVWAIVHERSGLGWDTERILIFAAEGEPSQQQDEGDGNGIPIPALSSIDVAES